MPPKPMFDRPMTSAEKQARYRARKAREHDRAARELLYELRSNLEKLTRYLTVQGDPVALATVLAELDGPPLSVAILAEATVWMARFAETYRDDRSPDSAVRDSPAPPGTRGAAAHRPIS